MSPFSTQDGQALVSEGVVQVAASASVNWKHEILGETPGIALHCQIEVLGEYAVELLFG